MPYIEEAIVYLQNQQEAEFKLQANYTLKAINSMTVAAWEWSFNFKQKCLKLKYT